MPLCAIFQPLVWLPRVFHSFYEGNPILLLENPNLMLLDSMFRSFIRRLHKKVRSGKPLVGCCAFNAPLLLGE